MKLDFNAKHYLTGNTQTKECQPLRGKEIGTQMNTDHTDENVLVRFAVI